MLRCLEAVRLLCTLALAAAAPAFAAHPLQTEDTGTQGEGRLELENGLAWTRSAGAREFLFQPQLSWGLAPAVDAIVQPAWLQRRAAGAAHERGLGDTQLDLKWRFHEQAPRSLALRAGLTLPTAQRALGLPRGHVGMHALLAASADLAPFSVHGNLGLARQPAGSGERRYQHGLAAALLWSANDRLVCLVDAAFATDPDRARRAWPGTIVAGTIITLAPGLDLDVGRQRSINAMAAARGWLAGLTWRFGG